MNENELGEMLKSIKDALSENVSNKERLVFEDLVKIIEEFSLSAEDIIKSYDEKIVLMKNKFIEGIIETTWPKEPLTKHLESIRRLESEREMFVKRFRN